MDFKTQFIKKFSKSRWERFDAAIRLMISHAVKAPDRQILEYTGDMVSNSTIRPHLNTSPIICLSLMRLTITFVRTEWADWEAIKAAT